MIRIRAGVGAGATKPKTGAGRLFGSYLILLGVVAVMFSSAYWPFKVAALMLGLAAFQRTRRRRGIDAQGQEADSASPVLAAAPGGEAVRGFGRRTSRPFAGPHAPSGAPEGTADAPAPAGRVPPGIEPELRRLDLYRRGLGAAAVRYVATGEDAAFPATVAALVESMPKYQAAYHKDFEGRSAAAELANVALMDPGLPASPVLARFLEIRLIADPPVSPYGQPPLTHVQQLCRAAFAAVNAALHKLSENYSKPWREARSVRQMLELVQCCGGLATDLFENVLAHGDAPFITKASWHESPEFAELVREHPAAFTAALPALDGRQRLAALKLLEHHACVNLPEILAALVAMLSRPYGKEEREAAISALARLDAAPLRELIARALPAADIDTRHGLVEAAGRNNAPALLELLQERVKVEKAAKVKGAIEAVLEASTSSAGGVPDAGAASGDYAAATGESVALPPLPADLLATPGEECRPAFDALVKLFNNSRAAELAKGGARQQWQLDRLQPIAPETADAIFGWLCDRPAPDTFVSAHFSGDFRRVGDTPKLLELLGAAPLNFALRVAVRMGAVAVGSAAAPDYFDRNCAARQFLRSNVERGLDLRIIAALAARGSGERFDPQSADCLVAKGGDSLRHMLKSDSRSYIERQWRNPLEQLPREAVWPWLAENMAVFDEAFGLAPMKEPVGLGKACTLLSMLPAVPQRYYARILEIAVTEKRPLRRQAMALLRGAKALDTRLEALLDDPRQPVRINAATWLADMRAAGAEEALRKRLKKERSDPVRTALIEALQRLEADLSDVISPASLLAEAQAAMAKGKLDLPEWLPVGSLPAATFRDGTPLPPDLLRYWLALAIRLKDPAATGQFGLYLDRLQPADARALSGWVLDHWIAYDTHTASLEEANAYALANYQSDWRWLHRPQTAELRDQIVSQLAREKSGEMLNSGSETKGMLALACRADPLWAAQRVRWFLKNHGRRSNQAMALLDMLAGMDSPVALQVVIAASVRLKQKSTQKHAAGIAERYAEDRGWSVDELADRTVPAAGFDDDGVLALPCGEDEKPYAARLDAQLNIHLFNPEGKEVKALPAGDDEATKESRKALGAARKELKQVVDLQSARLFEAMCVERSWPVADWRGAFHEHPVMRRLVERLVWQGIDAEGTPLTLFGPTQEGDFTDAADQAVDIDSFDRLRLAHGALVDAAACQAWLAHLRDYEVEPLIAQFGTTRAPLSAEEGEASVIEDRKGWVADSLTYRGIAEKRGYERVMGDGGGCNEYEKPFGSLGLTATIHHSGSHAQDENNPVALKGLSFRKAGHYAPLKLKDVPPVMLAECWADFHALAEKGRFDPEWEKKSPW